MTARSSTQFVLDDQLCFAVYTASRAITAAYREGLSRLGLTYTQYLVLLLLWEHDTLPMREVGARLRLDSATLSPLLRRLDGRGLVNRRRAGGDERTVQVSATPAGHELRERVHAVQAEVERATGLSGAELASMRSDLHQLSARLHEHSAAAETASNDVALDARVRYDAV